MRKYCSFEKIFLITLYQRFEISRSSKKLKINILKFTFRFQPMNSLNLITQLELYNDFSIFLLQVESEHEFYVKLIPAILMNIDLVIVLLNLY